MEPSSHRRRMHHHLNPSPSSWPSLPGDLLLLIATQLTSLEDFFAFRNTCRSWRILLPATAPFLSSQPPLLLLAIPPSFSESLFSISHRRLLRFRLPWPRPSPRFALAYSHGYLLTTTSSNSSVKKPLLSHIFCNEQIRLPKTPIPFTRAFFSTSPSSPNCIAVLFTPGESAIQYCHIGHDSRWRIHHFGAGNMLEDLVFVDGMAYVLLKKRRLAVTDLSSQNPELLVLGDEFVLENLESGTQVMLGECSGELVLVCLVYAEMRARVFRWECGAGNWVAMLSLRGRAVFVGPQGFAASVLANGQGVRADCVYAVGNHPGRWYEFNVVDGSFEMYSADCMGSSLLIYSDAIAPVWVLPSLC